MGCAHLAVLAEPFMKLDSKNPCPPPSSRLSSLSPTSAGLIVSMREDMARTALAGGGESGAAEEGEGKVRLQSSYRACTRDEGGRVGTPHAIWRVRGRLTRPPRGWYPAERRRRRERRRTAKVGWG